MLLVLISQQISTDISAGRCIPLLSLQSVTYMEVWGLGKVNGARSGRKNWRDNIVTTISLMK